MQDLSVFIFNHLYLSYAFATVLILLLIVESLRRRGIHFIVDTTQAIQLINRQNAVIIDIRSRDNFATGHIIEAQSIPAAEINHHPQKLEKFKTKPIVIVCNAGIESQKIAAFLIKQGYNAFSLAGGMRAWTETDLPLVKE